MAPRDLDAEFGPIAEPGDLDPTHLRAIGERLKAVVRQIEAVASAGKARDRKLETIDRRVETIDKSVGGISSDVAKLEADVKSIEEKVLTKEQVQEVGAIIVERSRRKWLLTTGRLWSGWIFGTIMTVVALVTSIVPFVRWLLRP